MKEVLLTREKKFFRWSYSSKISRRLAEEWNELSPPQVEKIMKLIYTPGNFHVIMQKCMKVLLRVNWLQFFLFLPEMKKLWIGDDGQLNTFLRVHTFFLFGGFRLNKNPFPFIKVRRGFWPAFSGKTFYGPRDYCENMQTDEFITAETYFSDYMKTHAVADLDLLVATLYRPRGPLPKHQSGSAFFCGDPREDFNDKTIDRRLPWVRKMPLGKKLAVLSFYRSCHDLWEQTYNLVFSGGKTSGKNYGWFEMLKAVNPADFGTIEQKEKTPIGNILLSMQIDIRDSKKKRKNKH